VAKRRRDVTAYKRNPCDAHGPNWSCSHCTPKPSPDAAKLALEALQGWKRYAHFIGWPNPPTVEDLAKCINDGEAALKALGAYERYTAPECDGCRIKQGCPKHGDPQGTGVRASKPAYVETLIGDVVDVWATSETARKNLRHDLITMLDAIAHGPQQCCAAHVDENSRHDETCPVYGREAHKRRTSEAQTDLPAAFMKLLAIYEDQIETGDGRPDWIRAAVRFCEESAQRPEGAPFVQESPSSITTGRSDELDRPAPLRTDGAQAYVLEQALRRRVIVSGFKDGGTFFGCRECNAEWTTTEEHLPTCPLFQGAGSQSDAFNCCGGNDEKPRHHCSDCPEHPWVGAPDQACVASPRTCPHAQSAASEPYAEYAEDVLKALLFDGVPVEYQPSELQGRWYKAIAAEAPRMLGGTTPVIRLRDIDPAYSRDHHPGQNRTTVAAAALSRVRIQRDDTEKKT
jgi:hypothetical protein